MMVVFTNISDIFNGLQAKVEFVYWISTFHTARTRNSASFER